MTYSSEASELSEAVTVRVKNHQPFTHDAATPLVRFVERTFIPNQVIVKSAAGRKHYQAILKHILRPETVQALFAQYPTKTKGRLKAVPEWPYLDDVRVFDLNTEHVGRLVASAIARGYSVQTVRQIKYVLGAIISHAKKEDCFPRDNPAADVKLPRLIHETPRDLTIDEGKAILRMLKRPEREIALFIMITGIGVSEICAVKWEHINLSRSTMCIEGQVVPPRGIIFRRTCTGSDKGRPCRDRFRCVVAPEPLIRVLERLKRLRDDKDENGFVLVTPQGNPLEPQKMRIQSLKPIARKLQIPCLSWQVLKRAHGMFLAELSVRLADDLVRNTQFD